ncbi:MAG: hypothetical protein ACI8TF_001172 [Paracoccaceae bacterium]|jgi:hypothetical protein
MKLRFGLRVSDMRISLSRSIVACLLLCLSACAGGLDNLAGFGRTEPAPEDVPPLVADGVIDRVANLEAEAEPPRASGPLGQTVATLGDPTRPGLWLKTPLVRVQREGQITLGGGASIDVTLIPTRGEPGSGSRISLAAMQALQLQLTDLANLTVIADP